MAVDIYTQIRERESFSDGFNINFGEYNQQTYIHNGAVSEAVRDYKSSRLALDTAVCRAARVVTMSYAILPNFIASFQYDCMFSYLSEPEKEAVRQQIVRNYGGLWMMWNSSQAGIYSNCKVTMKCAELAIDVEISCVSPGDILLTNKGFKAVKYVVVSRNYYDHLYWINSDVKLTKDQGYIDVNGAIVVPQSVNGIIKIPDSCKINAGMVYNLYIPGASAVKVRNTYCLTLGHGIKMLPELTFSSDPITIDSVIGKIQRDYQKNRQHIEVLFMRDKATGLIEEIQSAIV